MTQPNKGTKNYRTKTLAENSTKQGASLMIFFLVFAEARALDSLGGDNMLRSLDTLGGGNFLRSLDSLGGGNMLRGLDTLGGGRLLRQLDSLGGGNILREVPKQYPAARMQYKRGFDPMR